MGHNPVGAVAFLSVCGGLALLCWYCLCSRKKAALPTSSTGSTSMAGSEMASADGWELNPAAKAARQQAERDKVPVQYRR